jgi:isopenicillin N synthase-like dioxygenase
MSSSASPAIPLIRLYDDDLGGSESREASAFRKKEKIQCVRQACIETGFFYLENHRIPQTVLDNVLGQSRRLFALTLASKERLMDRSMSRGYTPMEEETLDPSRQEASGHGDTKEGFYIGNEISVDDPKYNPSKLRGPNQWPTPEKTGNEWSVQECQEFRIVMEDYFHRLWEIGLKVVQLIALAIGLNDEHYFDPYFVSDPMAALRLLHYSSTPSQPDIGLFGCGAHSDYGMITLLLTDHHPGLQILVSKEGEPEQWIDVPPRPDAFIVN